MLSGFPLFHFLNVGKKILFLFQGYASWAFLVMLALPSPPEDSLFGGKGVRRESLVAQLVKNLPAMRQRKEPALSSAGGSGRPPPALSSVHHPLPNQCPFSLFSTTCFEFGFLPTQAD